MLRRNNMGWLSKIWGVITNTEKVKVRARNKKDIMWLTINLHLMLTKPGLLKELKNLKSHNG